MTPPQLGPRTLTESARVEAFSDGVLAIALTLLVLDLHSDAQKGGFGHEIAAQWPAYLAYLAAFLNLSAIWINHHDLFARVHRVDARLLVVNLAVLFVASVFPWPTAIMAKAIRNGNAHDELVSTLLYAAIGFCVPVVFIALYRFLGRTPDLLSDPGEVAYVRDGVRRSIVSLVVYPLAAVVALVEPVASLVMFVALPAFFIGTLFMRDRTAPSGPAPAGEPG